MDINPIPKPFRKILTPKEYAEMRVEFYNAQKEHCKCGRWMSLEQAHIHHKKSRGAGGDDSRDNLELICYQCHRRIHDANTRPSHLL